MRLADFAKAKSFANTRRVKTRKPSLWSATLLCVAHLPVSCPGPARAGNAADNAVHPGELRNAVHRPC